MKYSRNKLQELSMLCIYQYLFYLNDENRPSLGQIIESVLDVELKDCDLFVKQLFKLTIENADEAVKVISQNLKDWTFDRLNLVEQAILLSSYIQFKHMKQPKQVAINVAIELAKKFCDDDSYKFINGVLDTCLI